MKKDISIKIVYAFDMCRLIWKQDGSHETYRLGEGFFSVGENNALTIGNVTFVGPTTIHAEPVDRVPNGKFVWEIIHGDDVDSYTIKEVNIEELYDQEEFFERRRLCL